MPQIKFKYLGGSNFVMIIHNVITRLRYHGNYIYYLCSGSYILQIYNYNLQEVLVHVYETQTAFQLLYHTSNVSPYNTM